jgi:DNA-directed RNA polymerase specialized sigma24 family protein
MEHAAPVGVPRLGFRLSLLLPKLFFDKELTFFPRQARSLRSRGAAHIARYPEIDMGRISSASASSSSLSSYATAPAFEPAPRRKCYNLTSEGFSLLLRVLGPDAEAQGRRYEEIRQRLMSFFTFRGCEAPEEMADEVFDRVAQRLREGVRVDLANPYSYFHGVAFLLFREHLRRNVSTRQNLKAFGYSLATPPAALDELDEAGRRLDHLRRGLAGIGEEECQLILAYYGCEDRIRERRRLSEVLGIPANALRIRVFRVRRRLERALAESGFFTPRARASRRRGSGGRGYRGEL